MLITHAHALCNILLTRLDALFTSFSPTFFFFDSPNAQLPPSFITDLVSSKMCPSAIKTGSMRVVSFFAKRSSLFECVNTTNANGNERTWWWLFFFHSFPFDSLPRRIVIVPPPSYPVLFVIIRGTLVSYWVSLFFWINSSTNAFERKTHTHRYDNRFVALFFDADLCRRQLFIQQFFFWHFSKQISFILCLFV